METFDSIFQRAVQRKGGEAALEDILPQVVGNRTLKRRPDSFYLAEMARCVFRAGFVWQIIDHKWPGFEEAFGGFDVSGTAMLSDEDLERLARDERIVRNAKKIHSVRSNAQFILDIRGEHGGFGAFLAGWPREDFVGMWTFLKARGERLGGQTGRFFLRSVGWDTPVLSEDVVGALIGQGVIDRPPTSARALESVQRAFNRWHEESGRDFCHISRILSATI